MGALALDFAYLCGRAAIYGRVSSYFDGWASAPALKGECNIIHHAALKSRSSTFLLTCL
jgi:hypothetical protein